MTASPGSDGPSIGEVSRLVQQMREDNRAGFVQVNKRLDDLVSKEVHDLATKALSDRIEQVRRDSEDVERRQAKQEEQRAADRRLVITAFLAPFVMLLVTLYVTAQIGPK